VARFLEDAVNALDTGCLYALFALGIALIFGVMRLINFAHGELIMIGAYALVLVRPHSLLLALVVCIGVTVLAALLMERIAFRPVRGANPATMLVTSFALSFALQNIAVMIEGSVPKSVDLSPFLRESWHIGSANIQKLQVLTIGVTILLVAALALFLGRTRSGVEMRAAAENFRMARLLGVRANRVIALAFGISGILAAVASVFLIARTGSVDSTIGITPVLYGFIATVLGGLGSLPGAALGGLLLGIGGTILQIKLPNALAPDRDAFLFGAVFLILVLRPQGLVVSRSQASRI
jgi:branched-chain amino acid transport system permease protein